MNTVKNQNINILGQATSLEQKLEQELEQKRMQRLTTNVIGSSLVEAALNLFVAADYLRTQFDGVCMRHGISHTQYNVLRILKNAYPNGHPRCEIMERMVERAPDTTRLLDRLEQQGYVERVRSQNDRRLSIARITSQGLMVLDEITPCFESIWQELSSKISRAESMMLSEICEKIYVGGYCKEVRIDM
jgi:MarR family transcriptional regulator, 2-MHQ and catechol-resistance regulon repressor